VAPARPLATVFRAMYKGFHAQKQRKRKNTSNSVASPATVKIPHVSSCNGITNATIQKGKPCPSKKLLCSVMINVWQHCNWRRRQSRPSISMRAAANFYQGIR